MFKNTIINLLGMLIPGLLTIPAMGYLARTLNVELFGILLLAYAIVGYSGIFDGGLARAVIRKIASSSDAEIDKLVMGTALISVTFFSLIPSLLMFFFAPSVSQWLNVSENYSLQAIQAIRLLGLVIPFYLIGLISFAFLEGKQRFVELNKYKVVTGILIALTPALMVSGSNTLLSAVVGLLIARGISALIALFALKQALGTLKLPFCRLVLIELVTFGGWITLSNIISPLMVYADKFILSNAVGANRVAFYNAPADLIQKIAILPGALARTLFPMFSNNQSDSKQSERIAYIGLATTLLLLLTPLFFFAEWVLNLWLGPQYGQESQQILKVLIIGFFFNGLAQIPFSRVQALGKSRTTAFLHLAEVLPYLLLLFLWVHEYGLIGAAYAWSVRMVVDFLLLFYFSNRYRESL